MLRLNLPARSRWLLSSLQSCLTAALLILTVSCWTLPAQATSIYEIPSLSPEQPTWVVDTADVISRVSENRLNRDLGELAEQAGRDVRFVTVRRLDYGETVDSFAEKLFDQWFTTPEAKANQTLIVVDSLTNNTAIITGSDVGTLLPADIADSVAQETMQAPLRQGNKYNQALLDASDRLVAVLSGNPDPGPPEVESSVQVEGTFTAAEDTDQGNATVLVVGFLVAATVIPMATYFAYQIFQS
ncbi:MAG: photosystem II repair protein Psb32 [Elainellaceae cyanobacterium]